MQLAVVPSTKWDRELVADLPTERHALREPQVMRIGGAAAANQTGLSGDISDVVSVAEPTRLGMRQETLVNSGRP